MDYIAAPKPPGGRKPFTSLPAMGDDHKALIVHRTKTCYLVLNRFPYNPGHLLAVPFREVSDLAELSPAERAGLMEIIIFGKEVLTAAMKPDGFNIGFNLGAAAGGSIAHLHAHIVPRWGGDNNFMPVLGQTRVLPQALESTWEQLRAVIEARKPKTARTRTR